VGKAKLKSKDMMRNERKLAVKLISSGAPREKALRNGGQTWNNAIEANKTMLKEYEQEAMQFIKMTIARYSKPVTIVFSGGKDSLCTLALLSKVTTNFHVIFIDTGIEFPETISYVQTIMEKLHFKNSFLTEKVGEAFWLGLDKFGPPGKDFRWCCKICKLGPMSRLISRNFHDGCLSFIGNRMYESSRRSRESRIFTSPWIKGQMCVYPIQTWNGLVVWLYLLQERIPINPLYFKGHTRIGCWLCPTTKLAEFKQLEKSCPNLIRRWYAALKKHGFSEKEIKYGLWRWRKLPPAHIKITKQLGISLSPSKIKIVEFEISSIPVCSPSDEIVLKGRFDPILNLERIANLFNTIGPTKIVRKPNTLFIEKANKTVCVSENGRFWIRSSGKSEENASFASIIVYAIIRAQECLGCGVCISHCPVKAIQIREGKASIDANKCNHCGQCQHYCPLVRFSNPEKIVRLYLSPKPQIYNV